MPITQTTAPSVEPVTLADQKNYLRVDSDLTNDDALIAFFLGTARLHAEVYTGRSFISQAWRLTLDSFPGPALMGVPYGTPFSLPGHAVLLERGPVLAITQITYQAMDSSWQTMPSTNYVAELSGPMGRITPVFGQIWPVTLPQIGAVRVDYTAGYGPAVTDVPEGIRQWIMMRAATLYENREEVAILNRGKVDLLPYIDGLLDPYRIAAL